MPRAFSSQGFKHYLGLERLLGRRLLALQHSPNYTCCARLNDGELDLNSPAMQPTWKGVHGWVAHDPRLLSDGEGLIPGLGGLGR